ncbi:MAG: redoxin family protein [Rubrivivax sp.]
MIDTCMPAPPLRISQWLNTPQPITLESLRGRVVLLHAFQMLCPGCVSQGIPQAKRLHALFAPSELAVIGLHTVFEHHAVMNAAALKVFVHEYRLEFPIGIDEASAEDANPLPLTMQAYDLQGTPSVVLIDRQGSLRFTHFGPIDDLALGVLIGQLTATPAAEPQRAIASAPGAGSDACDDGACAAN